MCSLTPASAGNSVPTQNWKIEGLDVRLEDGILTLTIDRQESLNSVDEKLLRGMADVLESAASDPAIGVVQIGGAGRAFCSGASLAETNLANAPVPTTTIDAANQVVRAIVAMPRPVIAAVGGVAAGVGVSIALACDLVIASEDSYFLLAFTRIGLMPDGGASALIAAAIGRIRAMRMALLAEKISAEEAYSWGLVTSVAPRDSFDSQVATAARKLASGPLAALSATKNAINNSTLCELEAALEGERNGQSGLLNAHDFREGVTAFFERRPANFSDM